MRRLGLVVALTTVACGSGEPDVVTGGFDESVIDKTVNEGRGVRLADLDNDGSIEVIGAFAITGSVNVYARNEDVTEPWEVISISGLVALAATDVTIADIDDDGDLDVVAISRHQRNEADASPGELTWFENPGDIRGIWKTRPITGATIFGPESIGSGDIDGDGRVDLVVGLRTLTIGMTIEGNGVYWFKNEDGGRFSGPFLVDADLIGVSEIKVVDLDEDGRIDVVATAAMGRQLAFLRNTTTATSVGRFVRYVVADGQQFEALDIANFDDDPQLEIVAGSTTQGSAVETGTVAFTIYDRPAILGDPWPSTIVVDNLLSDTRVSPTGAHVAAGDFNGDGRTDIVATTDSPGDLRVYLNLPTEWGRNDVRGGYLGLSSVTAADIDADGKTDIVTNTNGFGARDRISWWKNVDL